MRLVWSKSAGGTNSYDVYKMGGLQQQIKSNNQLLGLLMIGGDVSVAVNGGKDRNNVHNSEEVM
jgi:hypothetical protein